MEKIMDLISTDTGLIQASAEFIKRNCDNCDFFDLTRRVLARMSGKEPKYYCKFPGRIYSPMVIASLLKRIRDSVALLLIFPE